MTEQVSITAYRPVSVRQQPTVIELSGASSGTLALPVGEYSIAVALPDNPNGRLYVRIDDDEEGAATPTTSNMCMGDYGQPQQFRVQFAPGRYLHWALYDQPAENPVEGGANDVIMLTVQR